MNFELLLNSLVLIKPTRIVDERGYFSEIYRYDKYSEMGLEDHFVQHNHSVSNNIGTVRGLHFQAPPFSQSKLVRCGAGAIYDVAVDIRKGSPTYGQWAGVELSSENGLQLYIPIGFAHGFMTLEADSEIVYSCSSYYSAKSEGALRWNDPDIGIAWPISGKILSSEKDSRASFISDFDTPFTFGVNS